MRNILFILIIFFSQNIFCQQKKELVPSGLGGQNVVVFSTRHQESNCNLPFSAVKVLDFRFDSTKIGFTRNESAYNKEGGVFFNTDFKKMEVKGGLRFSVENFFNKFYANCFTKDSTELLILIKRFWVDPFPNKQVGHRQTSITPLLEIDLHFQFEFLLKKNEWYLPFKRIDTIFEMSSIIKRVGVKDSTGQVYNLYEYALRTVFESLDYKFYAGRFEDAKSKKTFADVLRFSEQRFQYPILKDNILKEGVYTSFAEFRNNKPSILKYKVDINEAFADIRLYSFTDTDSTQIVNYWGYCDGKKIYCKDLEHPLVRIGNTFEFFVDRVEDISNHFSILPSSVGTAQVNVRHKRTTLEPFQIDMETGKIY